MFCWLCEIGLIDTKGKWLNLEPIKVLVKNTRSKTHAIRKAKEWAIDEFGSNFDVLGTKKMMDTDLKEEIVDAILD